MTSDVAIFRWGLGLLILWVGSSSFSSRLLGSAGRALGTTLGLLLWVYMYWLWGSLGVLPDGLWAAGVTAILAWLLLFLASRFQPAPSVPDTKRDWMPVLLGSATFLLAVLLRSFSPDLYGEEKFTDLAMFQAVLLDREFPPVDRWLSGFSVNYYYFGFLLFSPLSQLLRIPPEYAFNLALCTVAALLSVSGYALVRTLGGSGRISLLGGFAAFGLGNLQWVQNILGAQTSGMFWWNSSRVIPDTINEFPFFSFLVGDLHPHYLALPWLALSFFLVVALRRALDERTSPFPWVLVFLTALSVGVHYPLNAWGLPFAAALSALVLGRFFWMTAVIGTAAYLLYLPYWIAYEGPVSTLRWVPAEFHSPPGAFLLHWGLLLAPVIGLVVCRVVRWGEKRERWFLLTGSVLAVLLGGAVAGLLTFLFLGLLRDRSVREWRPEGLLLLLSLATLILCELLYFQDSFTGDLCRMNTVFKFFYLCWWALAVVAPLLLQRMFKKNRRLQTSLISMFLLLGLVYPIFGTASRSRRGVEEATLDGMAYWAYSFPGERPVIDWLRENTGVKDVLLEASGPPYRSYGRFSSFSGRPAVLGWANHENIWRQDGYRWTAERKTDLESLNKNPSPRRVNDFVHKYRVKYFVVGALERRDFSKALLVELAKRPLAFSTSTTLLYRAEGPVP